MKPIDQSPDVIVRKIRADLDQLSKVTAESELSKPLRRKIDGEMRNLISDLGDLLHRLDPVRQPRSVFDPSNPKIIGRFIALALVAQQRIPLNNVESFYGSGVYAIYYRGEFGLYSSISNTETPIYVGKAGPAERNARTPIEQADRLSRRLNDHRSNIAKAQSTLKIADFEYRALVVQSGWETAAEDYLIHFFRPVWNNETKILYGLGKHGDDAKTRANKRSPWDTLHPGRAWAANSSLDARTTEQIENDLHAHFASLKIFPSLDDVLHDFVSELSQI